MKQQVVTQDNLTELADVIPNDVTRHIEIGCRIWRDGNVTLIRWPGDGIVTGTITYGSSDTEWGDWYGNVLRMRETDERYNEDGSLILVDES